MLSPQPSLWDRAQLTRVVRFLCHENFHANGGNDLMCMVRDYLLRNLRGQIEWLTRG